MSAAGEAPRGGLLTVAGAVRRIVVLTTGMEPSACYLARRLRGCGAEIFLVNQTKRKVEENSPQYFRRLFSRRGALVGFDNLLFHLVRSLAIRARDLPRSSGRRGGEAATAGFDRWDSPALRSDPGVAGEDWLTYLEISDVNRSPDQDRLAAIAPDLILLAGAPILSTKTIALARIACLNPHCGITPAYAGNSPFDWAIFEGRFEDIGYTVHMVSPVVDSGPVLHQERIEWDPSLSNGHLWPILAQRMYDKLAGIALALVAGEKLEAFSQGPCRVMPPAGLFIRTLSEARRMLHARRQRNVRPGSGSGGRRPPG